MTVNRKRSKRRPAGQGTISKYTTTQGDRYLIKWRNPDGDTKLRRGYSSEDDAASALGDILTDMRRGEYSEPAKITLQAWMEEWLDGLRARDGKPLAPSTMASYRKNVRLHVVPYIGSVTLDKLTDQRLTKLYADLREHGRRGYNHGGPLSFRQVQYVAVLIKAALRSAVKNKRIVWNPADSAVLPYFEETAIDDLAGDVEVIEEMCTWTAAQLSAFLSWAFEHRTDIAPAWHTLALTGMRRGELLALRWRDLDLDKGVITISRSLTPVRVKGEGLRLIEGRTKGKKPRRVDLDPGTVEILKAHRTARGSLALQLVRADAYVFANTGGVRLHPDRFTRRFTDSLASCSKRLGTHQDGSEVVPRIRLHDLRHTWATLALANGVPVKVVQERLGHATVGITMDIYAHVLPGMQSDAASLVASVIKRA